MKNSKPEQALWRRRLRRSGIHGRLAVVGNAGNEMGQNRGEEIDNHDCIFRFNNYEVSEEYQKDYGSRTTHWVTTFWFDINRRNLEDFKKVFCVFPLMDERFMHLYRVRKYHAGHDIFYAYQNKAHIEFLPFELFERLLPHEQSPSCGLLFLWWLKEVWGLENVDLYGFSFFDKSKPLHYFDLVEHNGHRGENEKKLVSTWMRGRRWI